MNYHRKTLPVLSRLLNRFRFRLHPAATASRKLLLVVEGRHDIEFLRRISGILHAARTDLPDLAFLERQGWIIFVPAGGGDFLPWTTRFAGLGCLEFHLYDSEIPPESARRQQCAAIVNARPGCRAFVMQKRSVENFLHPEAIREAGGLLLTYGDTSDVPALAAQAGFVSQDATNWESLSRRAHSRLRERAKAWLNTVAVERMTPERLAERDRMGEVSDWLTAIGELLASR